MDSKEFGTLILNRELPAPEEVAVENIAEDIPATYVEPRLKALVIDDDIVCRNRLKMLLHDFFDCTFVCDVKKGLSLYEQSLVEQDPFELSTIDVDMSETNSHETLEAIRKIEQQHGIGGRDIAKVIVTTSESSSEHVLAAFREGCEAYVVKTEMGDKLLDAVVQLGLLKVVKV